MTNNMYVYVCVDRDCCHDARSDESGEELIYNIINL